uniref:Uncharacterized protein n=1 Tax=Magallana gigas TaxID=29159 RepID=A0A8W8JYA7_MAGGI
MVKLIVVKEKRAIVEERKANALERIAATSEKKTGNTVKGCASHFEHCLRVFQGQRIPQQGFILAFFIDIMKQCNMTNKPRFYLLPRPIDNEQFQENERKLWVDGTVCEVETCRKLGPFSTFHSYINHWSKAHTKYINILKCSVCHENFVFENKGKQPIRTHRDPILEVQEKENIFYVEPGHCVPFRLGAPEERKRKNLEEEKALAQRK